MLEIAWLRASVAEMKCKKKILQLALLYWSCFQSCLISKNERRRVKRRVFKSPSCSLQRAFSFFFARAFLCKFFWRRRGDKVLQLLFSLAALYQHYSISSSICRRISLYGGKCTLVEWGKWENSDWHHLSNAIYVKDKMGKWEGSMRIFLASLQLRLIRSKCL